LRIQASSVSSARKTATPSPTWLAEAKKDCKEPSIIRKLPLVDPRTAGGYVHFINQADPYRLIPSEPKSLYLLAAE
jgi:hypothetical protein